MSPPTDETNAGPDPGATPGVLVSLGRIDTELYAPLRRRMMALDVKAHTLQIGARAPDFFLPNEDARLVPLATLLETGPVVLAFIAGSWCSFCMGKLRTLCEALRDRPATLVAVTPETGAYPRLMKTAHKFDCVVLSDVDYAVGLLFGVLYLAPPSTLARMKTRGLDLAAIHGASPPMLSAPALFVISKTSEIVFADVDTDYTADRRIEPVVHACEVLGA